MSNDKVIPLTLRRRLALEVSRADNNRRIEEHPLHSIFWECTLRCNLHCRHCGSDCRVDAAPDMPIKHFLKVLDNIRTHTDPHKVFVVITGGEPLMRDDLEECGRAIYDMGFPWGMVTNGLYLSESRFRSLRQSGLHSATVSLDGLQEDHTWMRRNPHSFAAAANAIKLMVDEDGFVFDVVTCVNRHNYAHLDDFKEILIGMGVREWRIFTVFPLGRAAGDPELRLSDEEFRGTFDFIRKTRAEGRIHVSYGCEGFLGNYEGEVRDRFFFCHAGVTVASVLNDGSISACPSIRANYHQGSIYENDFWEVWNTQFEKYRHREWMRTGECKDCKYFRFCRGNGMHLRDDNGKLLLCHLHRLAGK